MWTLDNQTPYAVGRNWTYDERGALQWVVGIKASFLVSEDGVLTLAEEQAPPALAPSYLGEPGQSSLRFEADLGLKKPATDVLINAFAHAPHGRAARKVEVGMRVGPLRKELVVYGERVYAHSLGKLSTSAPAPIEYAPIRYEYAYGGADLRDEDPRRQALGEQNPIGRGVSFVPAALDGQPAHSIEYLSGDARNQPPAGFGAIDGWWAPRRPLAGSYDERWEANKKPYLPDDYDRNFTLCAPADQRVEGYLRGGEPVELSNMTPQGLLAFELPTLRFKLETWFGSRKREHLCDLSTVILEPERRTLMMVWQSNLTVPRMDSDYLDRTVIRHEASS